MEWWILILVGLVSGTVGSLVGLGGGIITVPALLFLASTFPEYSQITPQVAVGTSLVLVIITALSSTFSYLRQKRVDFSSGLVFFVGSGPGAVLGAYLTNFFNPESFNIGFGILMILVAALLTFQNRLKPPEVKWSVERKFIDAKGNIYRYGYHRPTALGMAFVVGTVSSLFGIGGGALMMPVMVLLFRFPPHVATATSMLLIFLSSVMGSVTHMIQGNIDWLAVLLIAPGAWLGGQAGAWLSNRMSGNGILITLRLMIIGIAIKMVVDGLS
ncbi:sulfite exporter TauE/SafE family protein [Salinithrix halophila]|uniref:Probable membrane transporter protein n=1 Tax=Salinithrix halophila TaxID=1485204 RepID=A0ABV8JCJ5_9BACL